MFTDASARIDGIEVINETDLARMLEVRAGAGAADGGQGAWRGQTVLGMF
jgi:hypothetical protein